MNDYMDFSLKKPAFYWCFKCMLHKFTNLRVCPVCNELLSFNTFTSEQVDMYNRLYKIK